MSSSTVFAGKKKVLALNKSWQPLRIITLEEAMKKLSSFYKNVEPKAKIIHPVDYTAYAWNDWSKIKPTNEDDVLRTPNDVYITPKVIIYTRYNKKYRGTPTFNRQNIFKRDQYRCQYCGIHPDRDSLSIDHIVPRSKGGLTNFTNCVLACYACNARKRDRTPQEANLTLLKKPVMPAFDYLDEIPKEYIKSWSMFLSDVYWSVELENDM